ncbi:MAG: tungsten formylmethanofuran dehydrogenase [Candidatus Nephthysia bennettiae]|uniref:Tungsten formylmethanofuran dehydrogenase n=1 Tax=Candidatus Nephthysia bennettiae TaxID=3127016 RepID=A0A934N5I3_9BACT|nr:tungsten formylmethanofuran dehydrogenase [Candidatus Dormibacteraeota bacterium]MBJ7614768.1 tungsten formylmethanofuran dehydrogenase [Candidatus Dormibacteraeota bacterium]PZR98072.1 MAG: tungsten formylmethanofuran dehydrogenase [Candidatus Dormibacteraeota bacterium]
MADTQQKTKTDFNPDWHFQQPIDWRDTDLDEDTLKQWFHLMLLGRQIDYRCQVLNRQGRAPFIISCAGHEAAQIGVSWPLQPRYDWISPYYRDVVLCFRMGLTPLDLMLSVLAKPADPASGGKQTPGHFSDTRLNIISGGSPVATQMVHGAGAAYALKMDGTDKVVMTCYGEGAGAEGDTHEAFNFAAIYRLPEIFVCQNNGFAISVPFRKEYAVEYAAQRSAGYGFPGITVDGRDPVTCYHVSKQAVARARAGEGPTLIECLVDRLGAHSSEDDQRRYRSHEELDQLARNDCLERFKRRLLEESILDEAAVADYEAQVKDEVTKATREAIRSPDAPPENALTNVYSTDVPKAIEPDSEAETEEMNMVQSIRDALTWEMEHDERVMVLGEDVGPKGGVFLVTDGLWARFGEERVIDMPIAESSIAGVALGLSLAGKRPVAEMQFTDFAHMAFNQVTNEIAKFRYRTNGDWGVPLVIRAPMGGHVHGALYHSQSIEARFATPGLKIVIPSTPYEAKGLMLAAIRDPDPVLFFEHKRLYRMFKDEVPKGEYLIPLQKARIAREGEDLSVFCYGLMVHYALEAARALEEEGWSVEVVDLRTVHPLDREAILASARKTGKCLVLYEDNFSVSVGSEVAAIIADEGWRWLDAPVKRLGGLDVPAMPYAQPMEDFFMPDPEKVTRALRELAAF